MSASLGVMLKRLAPGIRMLVLEAGSRLAGESSDGWNNAGTGHAGYCELSYTPGREPDGSIDLVRTLRIFAQFEHSKQFWAHLVGAGIAPRPREFIRCVPHLAFVQGEEAVAFLRARHDAMQAHHFFAGMEFTAERDGIAEWAPLLVEGRAPGPVAATRAGAGTEVDFGALARGMLAWLGRQEGCAVMPGHRAAAVRRGSGAWIVAARHVESGDVRLHHAPFVFLGAGGGTLPLLQSTGLPEVRGLGCFPIGGQWLTCEHPAVVDRHRVKAYGAVPPASPSLGAGHLDRRRLDGREVLMFGPFATWTTRFLQQAGRVTDLPRSLRPDNLRTLLDSGRRNLDLVRYCMGQSLQRHADRVAAVREFFPAARAADWRLVNAGIRVQALKPADRGAIYFGTEVLTAADRSLAALLGASPGASVSASIALEIIQRCLPQLLSGAGMARMTTLIPGFDEDLRQATAAARFQRLSAETAAQLQLSAS